MTVRNKSIQDSFVYRQLNSSGRVDEAVTQIMQKGIVLTKENLEQAFLTINKSLKYTLKQRVMESQEQGEIILLYSPDNVKLPTTLPFFLFKGQDGRPRAAVAVDIHGSMNKETRDINIDAKKLYVTMEAAYIALRHFSKVQSFSKRTDILSLGSNIYANMIARCLNKKYALNVDKVKMHKVQFIAAKFFIMSIMQYDNEEIANNYAAKVCTGANPLILDDVGRMVMEEDLKDFSSVIEVLKRPQLNLGMSDLTVRGFLEMFINMYHHSSVLALELFPYFMYNINSAVHGAYINNQYMLEDIVDKVGPKLYVAVASTV